MLSILANAPHGTLQGGTELLSVIVEILVGLGMITAVAAFWRHRRNRRRWQVFKRQVEDWLQDTAMSVIDHPKLLQDDEWKVLCENLLTDSNFGPFEIHAILDLAVLTAKGRVAPKVI